VRVRSEPGQDDSQHALAKTLQVLANVAVKDYNRKHKDQIALKTLRQGDVEVRYLVNDAKFPKGFQPAFAVKDGYLVLASSPDAVLRFDKQGEAIKAGNTCPLLKVSFKQLATLVKDRREAVTALLAEKHKLTPQSAAKRVETLVWGLELFDTAELVQRTDGERVAWVLRLRTAEPAK